VAEAERGTSAAVDAADAIVVVDEADAIRGRRWFGENGREDIYQYTTRLQSSQWRSGYPTGIYLL
jgi:hypothetical protein